MSMSSARSASAPTPIQMSAGPESSVQRLRRGDSVDGGRHLRRASGTESPARGSCVA
jgi:hypothetical protein